MLRDRGFGGRGPVLLVAAATTAAALNFVFHAVGSRLLGPGSYSSLAALLALLIVVTVPVGAVQIAMTQASAASAHGTASLTLQRAARAGVILLLVGLVVAVPINDLLELHDAWGVALMAGWAALACVDAVARGALLGRLRYGPVAASLVIGAIARIAFAVALIPLLRVEGAMLATLLGELVATIVSVSAMTGGLLASRGPALRPRGTDASIALGAQLGLWLLAGITTVVGRRVLPDAAAGDFAAASTITGAATFLPLAVAAAYFPRFAKSSARDVLTRALMVAAAAGALVSAALVLAPTQLIRVLAGASFSADTAIVAMLSVASALVGVTGVAVFFLLARRRPAALSVWLGTAIAFACALLVRDALALAVVALVSAVVGAFVTILAAYRATGALDEVATEIVLPGCERDLTIVVPTYNSGSALRPALDAIVAALDTTGLSYEVLVGVDGSSDGSEHTLHDCPPQVVVDVSPVNEGKGAVVRRGFGRARGRLVGFIDGDGDLDPEVLTRLVRACERPDVWAAIASKHAEGAAVDMTLARRTVSRGYRRMVRVLFGLDVGDTQCGAKVFDRGSLAQALPWARERGFALDVELLALGRRMQLGEIAELPVSLRRAEGRTTVSARAVVRTFRETLRVWTRVLDAPAAGSELHTGAKVPASEPVVALEVAWTS